MRHRGVERTGLTLTNEFRAFLVLLACVLIAWWPLATFTYCVVHGDMLDCWLPWRTFIADCLQNGEWPVWNPYQQMGYPVHADLQGPAWYPEALLLGGTIGQSIYVLQSLVIVYLLVAGMGMYRLAKQFCGSHSAALAIGIAYTLSGFFTAHVMHQYSFISGAWWPWMFAAFLRLLDKPGWRPALETAVFQFLLLTGGNHTFTIIGAYLMLALIVVRCVPFLRSGDRRAALRLFGHLLLFACATLIMACGVLHAWWYSAPFIERMGGMDYAMAAQNPFTWKATLSFLIPWATTGGPEITGTNITMANAHMGILMLVLVPLAFLRKRTATENVLLVFGAVCLLASFGNALPVHRLLYSALPGLDVFRFPSYYTYFTLLCWLLPVARTLAQWNELTPRSRTALWALIAIAAAIILIAVLRAATIQFGLGFALDDVHANLFERMNATSIAERTIVHGVVQLALLAVFAAMLWKRKWFSTTRLVALVTVEGVIAVLLCSWQTGISDTSPSIIDRIVEMRPEGFPSPNNEELAWNKDDNQDLQPLWRNTNIFQKRVSHDGFNSYWPKDHLAMMNNSLGSMLARYRPFAYVDQPFTEAPDGLSCEPLVMRVRQISSTGFDINVKACEESYLVIQQNALPGWVAYVDGIPTLLLPFPGDPLLRIPLVGGEHLVEIRYELDVLGWLRTLSWCSFLIALWLLAISCSGRTSRVLSVGWAIAVTGTALLTRCAGATVHGAEGNARGGCPADRSGSVLYERSFAELEYTLPQRAEPIILRNAMVLKKDSSDWSPAFEMEISGLGANSGDALIVQASYNMVMEVDTMGGFIFPVESFLVLSVENEGELLFYRTKQLDEHDIDADGWASLCLIAQVEQLRWKPGTLKAYVWNNGPGTVLLDDFRVSVMPWDSLGVTY